MMSMFADSTPINMRMAIARNISDKLAFYALIMNLGISGRIGK